MIKKSLPWITAGFLALYSSVLTYLEFQKKDILAYESKIKIELSDEINKAKLQHSQDSLKIKELHDFSQKLYNYEVALYKIEQTMNIFRNDINNKDFLYLWDELWDKKVENLIDLVPKKKDYSDIPLLVHKIEELNKTVSDFVNKIRVEKEQYFAKLKSEGFEFKMH